MLDAPTEPIELNEILFNNLHYTTKALGLALLSGYKRSQSTVHYISFAGSNTACESTRASLHKRNPKLPSSRWSYTEYPVAPGMKVAKRKLPGSNELHYIMWDASAPLILIRDDRALAIRERRSAHGDYNHYYRKEEELKALKAEYQPAIRERFVEIINTHTKAPMLIDWADVVMAETEGDSRGTNKGWQELEVYGDVVFGAIVNLNYDWINRIRRLLIDKNITIPPLAPELKEIQALSEARLRAAQERDNAPEVTALEISILPDDNFLFEPGHIYVTANFARVAGPTFDYETFLWRHLTGHWTVEEMHPEDIAANQRAAAATGDNRDRVFSVFIYPHPNSQHLSDKKPFKFWIITEWDRSATTFMLPEDY